MSIPSTVEPLLSDPHSVTIRWHNRLKWSWESEFQLIIENSDYGGLNNTGSTVMEKVR